MNECGKCKKQMVVLYTYIFTRFIGKLNSKQPHFQNKVSLNPKKYG